MMVFLISHIILYSGIMCFYFHGIETWKGDLKVYKALIPGLKWWKRHGGEKFLKLELLALFVGSATDIL